jgi:uncharacterized SAM-binding protein YcdF (DUF218 family)
MIEIGFYLKKFISFFLEPIGLVLTLLFVGLYYLYLKKEHKAKIFLTAAFFMLFIFSYPPFANYLIKGLEAEYPKYDYKKNVAYIHVLGNGHTTDPKQPISSQISDAGVKRVLEGVIIHRKIPNSKIIFTGYEGKTDVSNAFMNAKLSKELGVSPKDILINPLPKDTKEEALFTKTIVQSKPFILVTSASHMPRAMMLFRSLGMHPIAAPTNFYTEKFYGYLRAPSAHALYISTVALHEYVGIVWIKLKNLLKGN